MPKNLYLLATMSVILMVLMTIVFISAFRRWYTLLKIEEKVTDKFGDKVLELVTD
jgi:carbon starvation protein